MKLFFADLRARWRLLLAGLLFCAIFAVTFALYGLPLSAVLYPALLCCLCAIVFLLFDSLRRHTKHRQLTRLRTSAAAAHDPLPAVSDPIEEDYQQILLTLRQALSDLETETAARSRDAADYYTMWVHQIKTPIASMRLTLQNEDSPISRRLSSELLRIEQYAQMALAFIRLEESTGDYVFRQQPLDPILRQAIRRFSSEFILRKLRLDYAAVSLDIVTDEKWLGFVIEQLLSNALKYTRHGGIRIYIEEETTLCIADSGIGIAASDLPRIFEKGYTGCNGRLDTRASGLGLYLCKRICDNLGIALSAQSQPGVGTTLRLSLRQYPLSPE